MSPGGNRPRPNPVPATLKLAEFTAKPRFASPVPQNVELANAQFGHELMGFEMLPQSVMISSLLEARDENLVPLYDVVVIQMGRRSSKTGSTDAVLLGRMAAIDRYKVVETAQSATIARDMFIGIQDLMDEFFPDPEEAVWQFKIGKGDENLLWKETRSRWHIVAPKPQAVRSKAADVVRIEEAGEIPLEAGKRLLQGVLPLMDTRRMKDRTRPVQLIIEGTPGESNETLLGWALEQARGGRKGWGILDFSVPASADPTDEALWPATHPGLASGMTTLDTLRERLQDLGPQRFAAEYLCQDPINSTLSVIDSEEWSATTVDHWLEIPTNAALAFAAEIDGRATGIVAAWFNDDGQPCIQTVRYRAGTGWAGLFLREQMKQHPAMVIGWDKFGETAAIQRDIEGTGRIFPQMRQRNATEVAAGVSLLMRALSDRTLIHAADPDLDHQAASVAFRYYNQSRLFARARPSDNIALMNAAALALYEAAGNRRAGATYVPAAIQF